jgi:hypothetical protein
VLRPITDEATVGAVASAAAANVFDGVVTEDV